MASSLEDNLSALLETIYASPQTHQLQKNSPVKQNMQQVAAKDADLFASDEFRMFCYKVVPCSIRGPHDWTTCGFCHPGEKATRRCPQKYSYTAIACPDVKGGECPRGENCFFAHNVFEYWLHPIRYRSQMCSYGSDCRRPLCFFAHHFNELRHNEAQLAQLQAIEREMEGGDAAGMSHGMSRWGSAQNAKSAASSPMHGRQQRSGEERTGWKLHSAMCGRQAPPQTQKSPLPAASQQALLHAALQNIATSPHASSRSVFDSSVMSTNIPGLSPMPAPHTSLDSPLGSMSAHDIDSQMAAAMKLIADLSATKQQMMQQQQMTVPMSGAGMWESSASPMKHQHQQPSSGVGLQSYGSAPVPNGQPMASLPSALPSADLHGAIMGLLPELLKQLNAGGTQLPSFLQNPPGSTAAAPASEDSSVASGEMAHQAEASQHALPSHTGSVSERCSVWSSGSVSSLSSQGCRSPSPTLVEGDAEEKVAVAHTGPSSMGLAGMGMDLGLQLGLICGKHSSLAPNLRDSHGCDEAMLHSSTLINSLTHLIDEPSTADMLPGLQELDLTLQKLSMSKAELESAEVKDASDVSNRV